MIKLGAGEGTARLSFSISPSAQIEDTNHPWGGHRSIPPHFIKFPHTLYNSPVRDPVGWLKDQGRVKETCPSTQLIIYVFSEFIGVTSIVIKA